MNFLNLLDELIETINSINKRICFSRELKEDSHDQIVDILYKQGYQKLYIRKYEEKWIISFET